MNAEAPPVAKLAGRAVVGQPGALAEHDDRHVRDATRPTAVVELVVGAID